MSLQSLPLPIRPPAAPTGRTNWKMPGCTLKEKPVAKILKHLRTVIICTFNHLQHRLFVNTIGKIGTLYQTWRSCCNKNQPGYPVPLMASHVSYRYCTAGGMSRQCKITQA